MIRGHVGAYALVLTQRLDIAGGSSRTADVVVSPGTYSRERGALSLADGAGRGVAAAMVWDTVVVVVSGRTYELQATHAG
jgi:hypothetical protein